MSLQAPFPYFGGKRRVADKVWAALGDPDHYIEPFFGSGAVLLARPNWMPKRTETVCDKNGFVANAWRAIQFHPDEVARWCDWPVNHADLMARKAALIREEDRLLQRLCEDERWYDPIMAGYWIWGASCWIGNGMESPKQLPQVGSKGAGVHKTGLIQNTTNTTNNDPRAPYKEALWTWFRSLSERLRYVRVVCGDWSRVCGGNWQAKNWKTCGIFFDPPYSDIAKRNEKIYGKYDSLSVAHDVREWAKKRGADPRYRIVLAGYYEEHEDLLKHGWSIYRWSTPGGYSKTARNKNIVNSDEANRHKETLFMSPHCLRGYNCL
jgi:site-specific DNA-adenine methylase